jgi:hypothetical protein
LRLWASTARDAADLTVRAQGRRWRLNYATWGAERGPSLSAAGRSLLDDPRECAHLS